MGLTALPPSDFRSAGVLLRAERLSSSHAPWRAAATPQPAAALRHLRGLRYESAVRDGLAAWADAADVSVAFGPWFRFSNSPDAAARFCQPDVLIDSGVAGSALLLLEIKLQFEPRAWWQLAELYRPVVEKATGRSALIGVIAGSYDPAVQARVPAIVAPYFGAPRIWLNARSVQFPVEPDVLRVLQWKRPGIATLDG